MHGFLDLKQKIHASLPTASRGEQEQIVQPSKTVPTFLSRWRAGIRRKRQMAI
jgi:hypothetical protein